MIPYSTCMRFNTRKHSLQQDKYCPAEWTLVQHIGFSNTRVESTVINVTSQDDQTLCFTWAVDSQTNTQQAAGVDPNSSKQRSQSDEVDRRSVYLLLALRRRKSLQQSIHPYTIPLLDPYYYGISERYLKHCYEWSFNTFSFDVLTSGHSLSSLLLYLFNEYDFFNTFHLDLINVLRCFHYLEKGYHDTNPYHNSVHAADVTQAMHCFLQEPKIKEHLTPLEAMCALLAAVSHDLDHPGVNQQFLMATNSHLTTMHNNLSVLESHHWRFALSCFYESHIFDHLSPKQWKEIKYLLKHLILATDISRQSEFLNQFRHYIKMGASFTMTKKEHKYFILQIALKCADLGNPCRPWKISQRWSEQICNEFYRQGDFERLLGLPVTTMCDRTSTTIAKTQTDFFKNVVRPLFDLWDLFLDSKLTRQLINNLNFNEYMWKNMEACLKQQHGTTAILKRCHSMPVCLPGNLNIGPRDQKQPRTSEHVVIMRSKSLSQLSTISPICSSLTSIDEFIKQASKWNISRSTQKAAPTEASKKCVNGCGTPTSTNSSATNNSSQQQSEDDKAKSAIDQVDFEDEDDDFIADFNCGAILSTPALILPNFCFEKPQSGFYRRGSAPGCIDIRRSDAASSTSSTSASSKGGHALLLLCNSLKASSNIMTPHYHHPLTSTANVKRRSSFPNVVNNPAVSAHAHHCPSATRAANLIRFNASLMKNYPELIMGQYNKKKNAKQQQHRCSTRKHVQHVAGGAFFPHIPAMHAHPHYGVCSLYDITNNNYQTGLSKRHALHPSQSSSTTALCSSYQRRRRSVPQDILIRSINNYTA